MKIMDTSFNLFWNTEKSKWPIFFECQSKVFEKVLEKISVDQP